MDEIIHILDKLLFPVAGKPEFNPSDKQDMVDNN